MKCATMDSTQMSMAVGVNIATTLTARGFKDPLPVYMEMGGALMNTELDPDIADMEYIVRRLTPLECERLQGLPDGYTVVHFTDEMLTDELVDEFIAIKLNWDTITAKEGDVVKAKSRRAMRSWLKGISEEPPDSPRFKACGNGWACNQPRWIVMNLLNTQYPGWDDVPCGTSSHGINPQNGSTMFPCSAEASQTLAVGHGGGASESDRTRATQCSQTIRIPDSR